MRVNIVIIFLILYCQFSFAQKNQNDTITLHSSDIKCILQKSKITNPRIVIPRQQIKVDKTCNKPLDGFYKIITGKNEFFLTKFKNGIEDNDEFNYIKYYTNGKLKKIDFKGTAFFGSKYLSIPNYSSKRLIKGIFIDCYSKSIIDSIEIKQIISKKHLILKTNSKEDKIKLKFSHNFISD